MVAGELSVDAGRDAALSLLGLPHPPTAIFADNLVVATGIVRVLQERKRRIPEDVELVSSDDAEWLDVFLPAITTIVQPSYELGIQAAELLLKRIRQSTAGLSKDPAQAGTKGPAVTAAIQMQAFALTYLRLDLSTA